MLTTAIILAVLAVVFFILGFRAAQGASQSDYTFILFWAPALAFIVAAAVLALVHFL